MSPKLDTPIPSRRLSENALFPKLFVILKKLSSEYQLYACGNFFRMPRFWKKLLFSDSLLAELRGRRTHTDLHRRKPKSNCLGHTHEQNGANLEPGKYPNYFIWPPFFCSVLFFGLCSEMMVSIFIFIFPSQGTKPHIKQNLTVRNDYVFPWLSPIVHHVLCRIPAIFQGCNRFLLDLLAP